MIVSVSKDEVKITELSQVNQGDYKVNLCTFILPEYFSGLSVTAVFNGIHVPVAGNRCYIPTLENGNCILGVYAYKEENGETELMYSPKPTVFYVDKGSFTTDVNTEDLPKIFDYETYCNMLKEFWEQIINENTLTSYDENAEHNQYYSAKAVNEITDELKDKKIPYPLKKNKETGKIEVDYGSRSQTLKTNGAGSTYWEDEKPNLSVNEFPFEVINLPLTQTNYAYIYKDGKCQKNGKEKDGKWTEVAEDGFSPITKCPQYLGFRIDDDETRLYLYIGDMVDGEFVLDEKYHIDTTDTGAVNHLRQSHNRFIKIDGEKYFYYKINKGSKVTLMGCDAFPQGESEIIATVPNYIKGGKKEKNGNYIPPASKIAGEKYYSVVLPSGCFYAVFAEQGMPTFLKPDDEDEEETTKPTFNVSYQTGVNEEDGSAIIEVNRGASFGYIPENVGAALLRLPKTYNLNDLCIYTDNVVKINAKSGRRRKAKEIGEKVIKDFVFKSRKEIFWNDSVRPMREDRTFYGVPYSSRWVNSHYLGFEVSAETVLNALNDPYSVAYDGGFVRADFVTDEETGKEVPVKKYRDVPVSGHTEIPGNGDEPEKYGGPGYGLVCSAFTNLICGNPYPQSNRGYTFDSNYVLEDTVDMNSGEVLVNKGLSHCVFVDEIYDNGYSLYEAVDPCVAKTTHTCPADKTTYAASEVRTSSLDKYVYSVTNKDISGYDEIIIKEGDNKGKDKLARLKEFDVSKIPIVKGSVRPWRGNRAVYGPWDKVGKSKEGIEGSGIGVTIHNKDEAGNTIAETFTLKTPSKEQKIGIPEDVLYLDISEYVKEDGSYEIISKVKKEDGTYENVSEFFRFYNHDTVQLTFDAEGKAVFKYSDGENKGKVAEDVEYIYVNVLGYGKGYDDFDYNSVDLNKIKRYDKTDNDNSFGYNGYAIIENDYTDNKTIIKFDDGAMVIAKGNYYPDLALHPQRIVDVRAAIVSDITTDENPNIESWGKYSCATSPDIVSDYADPVQQKINGAIGGIETGLSTDAKNLLVTILRNSVYSTDQSENITALETALASDGGEDSGGDEPVNPDIPDEPDDTVEYPNYFNGMTTNTLIMSGNETDNVSFWSTDYIEIPDGMAYVYPEINEGASVFCRNYTFYDANKAVITYNASNGVTEAIAIPEGAVYVRFTLTVMSHSKTTFYVGFAADNSLSILPYSEYQG